jgi:hypothetical protein
MLVTIIVGAVCLCVGAGSYHIWATHLPNEMAALEKLIDMAQAKIDELKKKGL